MKIPRGFDIMDGNTKDCVLKLKKNVCGQVQAGHVWNKYLVDKLADIGFVETKTNE